MSEHSFANNFWGKDDQGVHNVFLRMKNSKQTNEEVRLFYKERIAIEEEYSKRMLALSRKSLGAVETGSLQSCLETIRQDTEAMGKSHATAAQQLKSQLEEPLVAFNSSMRERRKTTQQTVEKLLKAKIMQNNNVEKAREKFELDCNKINGYYAQQNLLMGKELEKNNQKLDKTHMSVNATKRDYQTHLRNLADIIDRWNKEWKVACDKLQDIEEERINFLKSNLWGYTNIVSTVCVSDDECCENIRLALEKTDVNEDIMQFVRDNSTGAEIQDPPEFINFLNGHSHDNVENSFKVAQFPRIAGTGDESMDDMMNSSIGAAGSHVMDPDTSFGSLEQAIPDPKPAHHSPLHNIAQTARDVFSFKLGAPSSTAPAASEVGSSVYSEPDWAGSSVNEPSSVMEPSGRTEGRSWATPFRRRSKKDLNKGWNRSQSRDPAEERARTPNPRSRTPYDSNETHEALSVGANTFDLSPSKSPAPQRAAMASSPAPPSTMNSASSQNVKKLSRDDPLVAALEQLKLSVGSSSSVGSSVSSAPNTEPHSSKYGTLGSGQPISQRRVASRSAPSSPGRSFEPSYLNAPAPAFTARDMQQTSQQYAANMFGEGHSRDSGGATREPVHRKPVQRTPERGRAPRSDQPRPKSYYEGASAEQIQRQLYAEQGQRAHSPSIVGDNHYPRTVSPDPQLRSVSPNPAARPGSANPYSEPLHGRSQPNLYAASGQQRPQRSHTPNGRSYDLYGAQQQQQQQYHLHAQQQQQQQYQDSRPRSKSMGEPRVDPRMDPRFNPDPRMSSPRGAPQLPRVSSDGRPVISYSRAQYDYRAAIAEEVSFRKGEVMLVLRMQDDGWWEVEVYGRGQRTGLAPSNFLADI
ncbi:hypothetical protein B0I73DRAFT_127420 [Yarrowia lipolytica]|jgi:hypothetical protein|uniref:YALI0E29557p n=2 Tax=Yarrowia lipolytica TaxID=4952 RepID=Q6C455_YARLI|nr:YALI0E29557p [Yarrowia lipolytica CLIB122]AOW06141.1 hypothetical protein YALI1_E34979g [Yarrowia lipolytica]KAB8285588.1 hypothetical protein BKA91DRAFT_133309 [Yarrowia lipolytica]KAE8175324.1 hypothetical protein BKA90DRAFT_132461 [Yarrowia lipolytica]KAJ8057533.1 hypothetical protein LXG23DRAFT_34412 [Yarrowia lipolytica]QNP99849.1 Septation protein imp2 [Yarrowia lipolytica]|eukprot:XP_504557.1 YALI0E29557p [Yarrowia lipolytica CLIB122]